MREGREEGRGKGGGGVVMKGEGNEERVQVGHVYKACWPLSTNVTRALSKVPTKRLSAVKHATSSML